MTDDGGGDSKVIAVPHDKLSQLYVDVKEYTDLPPLLIQQIEHFFANYKDLEKASGSRSKAGPVQTPPAKRSPSRLPPTKAKTELRKNPGSYRGFLCFQEVNTTSY